MSVRRRIQVHGPHFGRNYPHLRNRLRLAGLSSEASHLPVSGLVPAPKTRLAEPARAGKTRAPGESPHRWERPPGHAGTARPPPPNLQVNANPRTVRTLTARVPPPPVTTQPNQPLWDRERRGPCRTLPCHRIRPESSPSLPCASVCERPASHGTPGPPGRLPEARRCACAPARAACECSRPPVRLRTPRAGAAPAPRRCACHRLWRNGISRDVHPPRLNRLSRCVWATGCAFR